MIRVDTGKWKSQLRKGMIEYGLLHLIKSQESIYGVDILTQMSAQGMEISEGTLYPLLSRLSHEGLVNSVWVTEQTGGHPRKYYTISKNGISLLKAMDDEWEKLVISIQNFKSGSKS